MFSSRGRVITFILGLLFTTTGVQEAKGQNIDAGVQTLLRYQQESVSGPIRALNNEQRLALEALRPRLRVTLKVPALMSALNAVTQETVGEVALRSTPENNTVIVVDSFDPGLVSRLRDAELISSLGIFEQPALPTTQNLHAQISHRTNLARQEFMVSGRNVGVAIIDGGSVVETHQEFGSRVALHDKSAGYNDHATHVAGTVGASGVNNLAQGMAPNVVLHSYSFANDLAKIAKAVKLDGIAVTNHSYGFPRGWDFNVTLERWIWFGNPLVDENEDYRFGKYTDYSRDLDQLAFDNSFVTMVKAAGNDNGSVNNPQLVSGWDGSHIAFIGDVPQNFKKKRKGDSENDGGFDTLGSGAVAKNVITIGAVADIPAEAFENGGLAGSAVKETRFSSCGWTDDFRVKPDLVANGDQLFSPTFAVEGGNAKPDAYDDKSGTSMATPTASGILAILNELAKKPDNFGRQLRSDESKAVLVATAEGVDAPHQCKGWGSIDALDAARVISNGNVRSETLSNSPRALKLVRDPGVAGPRVVVAWIDRPGFQNSGGLDDSTKALIHDVDTVLKTPRGNTIQPWSLDPMDGNPVRDRPNERDNVEVITLDSTEDENGVWTLEIAPDDAGEITRVAVALWGFSFQP